ncbi:hypothetical protein E4U17_000570 [Claviceps sp. LM77 group G4]|nr:hypothetical protein E4U17_000570 [Claviceps sp. LM77 group G4]
MATPRMASSVMYDDTQMATEKPRLNFKDIVFWVHDKVPSRNFIVGLIEDNGGVISSLAAEAKVRIEAQNSLPSRSALPKPRRARTHTCSTPATFTHAEDVALDRFVRAHSARRRAGQPLYKIFAKSNTSHSWQTWRKRWVEVLSLRPEPGQLRITFGPKLATTAPSPNARLESNMSSSAPEPPRESPLFPKSRLRPKGQQKLSWGPTSATAATSPAPSPTVHRALSECSSTWEAPLDLTMSRGSSPAPSEDGSIGTQVDERSQFFYDLLVFAENGANVCVEPSVGGQNLDLWELSRAVAAQQVPNDMVDWLGVAQRLNLKPTRDGRLAKELQACYNDNLAEFLQVPASAPEPPRESPLLLKSCPRFKGQQKLSWGPTSATAATSPAPSPTVHRALSECSSTWEAPLDLTMSRGSSPAPSEDGIWMPTVRLSRVSPDLHKKETRARPQREPPSGASNDCGIATGVLGKRRRGEGVDGDDEELFKLSPHRDDSHGKKTALSIPSTAADKSTQREPDKHQQAQPPFSPQASWSKRGRKRNTLCWFRV